MKWNTLAHKVRTMWEPRGKTFKIPSWILIWDLKIENWDWRFQTTSNSSEYLKIEDWLCHSIPILWSELGRNIFESRDLRWLEKSKCKLYVPTHIHGLRCDFNTCNAPELNLNSAIHPKNAMLGLQMLDLDFVSGSMQRSTQIGLDLLCLLLFVSKA